MSPARRLRFHQDHSAEIMKALKCWNAILHRKNSLSYKTKIGARVADITGGTTPLASSLPTVARRNS